MLGRAFAIEFGYPALLAFVIMGVATCRIPERVRSH